MKKKKAFTLIELVVATSILTIAVFGIYKLISENNKLAKNSELFYNTTLLFPSIEACIDNLKIDNTSYISFGSNLDECLAVNEKTIIDNIEYNFKAIKKEDKIWGIEIFSDFTGTLTGTYIQN